jgi:hypothetical protein
VTGIHHAERDVYDKVVVTLRVTLLSQHWRSLGLFAAHQLGFRPMSRQTRRKRDLHALTDDGMVLCNPRDREAAHRAEMEGIATDDHDAVTCPECRSLLYKQARQQSK